MVLLLLLVILGWPALSGADVDFDGVDDVLDPSLPLSTFVTNIDLTVMAWVFPTVAGGDPEAINCSESRNALGDFGGYLALGWFDTGPCGIAFPSLVTALGSPNAWTHLALRQASGTLSLWVNGVLSASTTASGPTDLTYDFLLGATKGGPLAWFQGRIASLRTYTVAVPDGELATLGKSRLRRVAPTRPSGQWELDTCPTGSGHGVTFPDTSGHSRPAVGHHGANTTGLLCQGSTFLKYPWGVW